MQRLELYANQLNGSLPGELAELRNLTKLSLAQNHLTGSIPVGLGQMEHLQELNLAHNKLTGQIPKDSLQGVVSRLLFGRFGLADIFDIYIYIYGNQGCSKLTEVILTWIWSGQELSQLGALEKLWLGENQLTGSLPKELGQLKQLEIMCLEHNQLAGAGVV